MKEFIEKLIGRLEEEKERSYYKATRKGCRANGKSVAYGENLAFQKLIEIVNQLAEEYKQQNIDQDLIIVESIPSLYPMMPPFEEEAVYRVVERARYNNGWISVLDKVPDKDMWCLATFESGGIDKIQYLATNKWGWNGELADNRVVAWCPLPEPYKPKGE